MLAYHNDRALKDKIMDQLQKHYKHDEIVKGVYWENGKGCAIGCIMQRDNKGRIHTEMQNELGIPQPIPRLIDEIFEGLDNKEAKEFPLKIMGVIQPGKDLSNVWLRFIIWLLIEDAHGVIKHAKTSEVKDVIKNIAALYERKLKNEKVTIQEWREAKNASYAAAFADASYAFDDASYASCAAAAAAFSAAAAAFSAAAAAYTVAGAAAYVSDAAFSAADAAAAFAADDADYTVARKKHFKIMADKLIELVS